MLSGIRGRNNVILLESFIAFSELLPYSFCSQTIFRYYVSTSISYFLGTKSVPRERKIVRQEQCSLLITEKNRFSVG